MKIEISGPSASQLLEKGSKRPVSNGSSAVIAGATEDRTTLSAASISVQSLATQALQTPEVRSAKIDALRQAIGAGQYGVDSAKIAAAIAESGGK